MKVHRISAKAIIVNDDKLLLTQKSDEHGVFYILPGGGQEHGESLRDTIVREVLEETGYSVEPGDVIFVRDYIGANHEFAATSSHFHQLELYFSARLNSLEMAEATIPDTGQTGIVWIPLKEIENLRVYPLKLRTEIRNLRSNSIYMGDVN